MKYRLVYTHQAVKDIQKLEPQIKRRIGATLLRYKNDPLSYAKRLTNSKLGTYRIRIGDYRVVFDLEGSDIVILKVGHRRDIYRR